jgi:hypothetical protein
VLGQLVLGPERAPRILVRLLATCIALPSSLALSGMAADRLAACAPGQRGLPRLG